MFLQQFPFKKIKFSARRFDTHAFSSTLREKNEACMIIAPEVWQSEGQACCITALRDSK